MAILTESAAEAERRPDVSFRPLATSRSLEFVAVWDLRTEDEPLVRGARAALAEIAGSAVRAASTVSAA